MSRWLRLLYPSEFARRYGHEIAALLKVSRRPVRDHLDVVVHAIRVRSEHVMSRLPRYLTDLASAVAIFLFGFVVNDLDDGLGELPRHWWSAAAGMFVLVATFARAAVTVIERRRTNRPHNASP
jgi:hypothetical protein